MADRPISSDQRATLGCGTLILIALIVVIFANLGDDELQEDLRRIEEKIDALQTSVAEQDAELEALRNALEGDDEDGGANP